MQHLQIASRRDPPAGTSPAAHESGRVERPRPGRSRCCGEARASRRSRLPVLLSGLCRWRALTAGRGFDHLVELGGENMLPQFLAYIQH